MEKQNVTLSLPRTLLRSAKIIAAKSNKSLSELMRESLEERVQMATGFKKAKQRQSMLLKTGLDLGTKGRFELTREQLHER